MPLYTWDEVSNELRVGPNISRMEIDGWRYEFNKGGVWFFRSDRGHLALQVRAADIGDANTRMFKVSQTYRDVSMPPDVAGEQKRWKQSDPTKLGNGDTT